MHTILLLLLSASLTASNYVDPYTRDFADVLQILQRENTGYDGEDVMNDDDDGDRGYDTATQENDVEYISEERERSEKKEDMQKEMKDDERYLTTAEVLMPDIVPKEMDTYFCVAYELPKGDNYLVKYEPAAKMQIAHHMLMYGCEQPFRTDGKSWSCREMAPVCEGYNQTLVYAWGKNAPELSMPRDVGFHVGGNSGYKYLVLQVHYLHVSMFKGGKTDNSGVKVTLDERKKKYVAGIWPLIGDGIIPPHRKKFHMDMGCYYPKHENNPTLTAFRFRVHAHKLGSVITAYRVRDNKWTLMGRGDPQIPQAFYRTAHEKIQIKPGDTLMGRCTYNSESRNENTYTGARHTDEMCNFYVMYYYDPKTHGEHRTSCVFPKEKYFLEKEYPKDSDVPRKKENI